jgi:hypothetical protein
MKMDPVFSHDRQNVDASYLQNMEFIMEEGKHKFYKFSSQSRPPIHLIKELVNESWSIDYKKKDLVIFKYTTEYLDWLMPEGHFFGFWVVDENNIPRGCMFNIIRDFTNNGMHQLCYYATLNTVHSQSRRSGLSNKMVDLMMKLFDDGKIIYWVALDTDSPGRKLLKNRVSKDVRETSNFFTMESIPYRFWAASSNLSIFDKYERFKGVSRLVLTPVLRPMLEFRSKKSAIKFSRDKVIQQLSPAVHKKSSSFRFDLTKSIQTMYQGKNDNLGGTWRYCFKGARSCEISYSCFIGAKEGLPDIKIAHIQRIDQGDTEDKEMVAALRDLTNLLFEKGHSLVMTHHTGMVDTLTLVRSGYLPSDRKMSFMMVSDRQIQSFDKIISSDVL